MRMVAALVVVLLAWMMLMFAATSSSEITQPRPRPPPIELDLGVSPTKVAKAKYAEAIEKLRDQLKDKSRFGIPMLRKPAEKTAYIYVRLIAPKRKDAPRPNAVELAISKNDVYVVGYSYKNGTNSTQVRARFFSDIASTEYTNIFREAKNETKEMNMSHVGSYPALEIAAGVSGAGRRKVQLGMKALGYLIDKITKDVTRTNDFHRNEARLLLIAIQMVCEAARFKYIEKQVRVRIPGDFNPDFKVLSLQNNWGSISMAIASVEAVTQKFKHNVTLWDPEGRPWVITTVEDIRKDMGLLNYVPFKWLTMQLDHNVPEVSAQ